MSFQLPNNQSDIAKILQLPHRTKGLQIDYDGNMLPYSHRLMWNKKNLYDNTKHNYKTHSWKMNKP